MTDKVLKLSGTISGGTIHYHDKDYREKIDEFKTKNENSDIDIVFESHDRPQHYQYKYLYGYVYPAIAEFMGQETLAEYGRDNRGDPGIEYVDRLMKQHFLFVDIESWEDIPKKHRSRCKEFNIQYMDNGELKNKSYGYIPSKTTLTFKEMVDYINKCDMFLQEHEGWCIPEKGINDMVETRRRASEKKTTRCND